MDSSSLLLISSTVTLTKLADFFDFKNREKQNQHLAAVLKHLSSNVSSLNKHVVTLEVTQRAARYYQVV